MHGPLPESGIRRCGVSAHARPCAACPPLRSHRTGGLEHTLAHIGHWQGDRARYWGVRKNLFDLRRCAVVHNLHVLARWDERVKAAG